jgi:hypothetical protein
MATFSGWILELEMVARIPFFSISFFNLMHAANVAHLTTARPSRSMLVTYSTASFCSHFTIDVNVLITYDNKVFNNPLYFAIDSPHLIESMSFIVVEQSAVNVLNRVRLAVDVGKVGVGIDLKHANAISEDSSKHNMTNFLHLVSDERINFRFFHGRMIVTTEVFLPCFWISAIAASAAIRC